MEGMEWFFYIFGCAVFGALIGLGIRFIILKSKKTQNQTTSVKSSDDKITKLEKLAQLKKNGDLTEEEYKKQKKELLS